MDKLSTKVNSLTRALLALAASGALAIAPGCSLLPKEDQALQPPLVKPVKENFELYEVKKGTIARQLNGTAIFAPSEVQYLSFKESNGRLDTLNVKLGDSVKPGDVVAQTETGDLNIRIRQQQLSLEKAQILLDQTRAQNPGDSQAIRLKSIDVESAQLVLKGLQDQLTRTKLVSDIGGVVTYIDSIKQGDPVTAYKQIITVANPKKVNLVFESTNPNDLSGINLGMDVDLKIGDGAFKGKVLQIPSSAPQTDNKSVADKNAKSVYFSVENPPDNVQIGSSASFTLTLEKKDEALVIPRGALRSYIGRDYVQVLEGESRKEIDVEKGIVTATQVEIRKGLKEGQKIIVGN